MNNIENSQRKIFIESDSIVVRMRTDAPILISTASW